MVVSLQTVIVTLRKNASGSRSSELLGGYVVIEGFPLEEQPQKRPTPGSVQVNILEERAGGDHNVKEELTYS